MSAPQDKTPPFESLSEAEKSALRAQAYPGILDDRGREWKLGMIADQAAKIAAQEATIDGLVAALESAKKCIEAQIQMEQRSYDEPPEPASEWDLAALLVVNDIGAAVARARSSVGDVKP